MQTDGISALSSVVQKQSHNRMHTSWKLSLNPKERLLYRLASNIFTVLVFHFISSFLYSLEEFLSVARGVQFWAESSQFSSVQLLSHVWFFVTPWTTACQAFLSITNSRSPPKLMSIESVMPSNHLILCHPLLLLPSIFLSVRVFSNESALCMRWPKYWHFSLSISPSNEHPPSSIY